MELLIVFRSVSWLAVKSLFPSASSRQIESPFRVLLTHDSSGLISPLKLHRGGRFPRPVQYLAVEIASGPKFQKMTVKTRLAQHASFSAIRLLCDRNRCSSSGLRRH